MFEIIEGILFKNRFVLNILKDFAIEILRERERERDN